MHADDRMPYAHALPSAQQVPTPGPELEGNRWDDSGVHTPVTRRPIIAVADVGALEGAWSTGLQALALLPA